MHHWVHWNLFIDAYATSRVRIEDFDKDRNRGTLAHSLCADLKNITKCPSPSAFIRAATTVATDNHSNHTKKIGVLDWPRLINHDVETAALAQLLAVRYGYDVPPDDRIVDPSIHTASCFLNAFNLGRWTCQLVHKPSGGVPVDVNNGLLAAFLAKHPLIPLTIDDDVA